MAAFMERGFGRAGLAIGEPTMGVQNIVVDTDASATAPVAVRELTIIVPGESNAFNPTQLVHLQGRVEFYDGMYASRGCPCWFYAMIRDLTTDETSVVQSETFETATTTGAYAYSLDAEALFAAPPGPRTYRLEAALYYRTVPSPSTAFFMSSASSLSATTSPFGPAGNSDL
jgi:hypothetical protein